MVMLHSNTKHLNLISIPISDSVLSHHYILTICDIIVTLASSNSIPGTIWNTTDYSVDTFNQYLEKYVRMVPDEPTFPDIQQCEELSLTACSLWPGLPSASIHKRS